MTRSQSSQNEVPPANQIRRAVFVVGHENWGKSRTLLALTNARRVHRVTIDNVTFFIKRMSNDDRREEYQQFIDTLSPTNIPNLIAALCPNFVGDDNDTPEILTTLRTKGYEMFFWVIEHQHGKEAVVDQSDLRALETFGRVEVFSERVEADLRATQLRVFIATVVAS